MYDSASTRSKGLPTGTIMQMQLPLLEKSEALPFMWRCQLMEDMFRACKLLLNLLVFVAFCDSWICRYPGG